MDIAGLYRKYKESGIVSTDTRRIVPGALFFSLKGRHFNANELAHEALSKGASYAVIDEKKYATGNRYILVKDCLYALQQLASYHRQHLTIPIIALTGSNGKTTSKELLAAILRKKYNTQATTGNLNNHIGVPLTLLSIDKETEIAIVEMGANHVGEIATLCRIAAPTHGAITNISPAHIGTFGSLKNIIRAKGELYQYFKGKDHVVWVNSQNTTLVKLSGSLKKIIFYPNQNDDCHCELASTDSFVKVRVHGKDEIQTHLTGAYNFENIALALCIGRFFNVCMEEAKTALSAYQPNDMRSQIIIKGTNEIILDAYNANPSSMEEAIKSLSHMKSDRKVVILGDMYELGDDSDRYHTEVLRLIDKCGVEAYLCGELFCRISKEGSKALFFKSIDDLKFYLREAPITHATVLIKASRGMYMERILNFL